MTGAASPLLAARATSWRAHGPDAGGWPFCVAAIPMSGLSLIVSVVVITVTWHPEDADGSRNRGGLSEPRRHYRASCFDGLPHDQRDKLPAARLTSEAPQLTTPLPHDQRDRTCPNMTTVTPLGPPGPRRRRSSTPGLLKLDAQPNPPPESVFPRARHGRSLPRCGELAFRVTCAASGPNREPGRIPLWLPESAGGESVAESQNRSSRLQKCSPADSAILNFMARPPVQRVLLTLGPKTRLGHPL